MILAGRSIVAGRDDQASIQAEGHADDQPGVVDRVVWERAAMRPVGPGVGGGMRAGYH